MHEEGFYDSDFIDLFNSMCAYDPTDRLTIDQILNHA